MTEIVTDEELIEDVLWCWEPLTEEEVVEKDRWHLYYEKVVKSPEGKLYRASWAIGATEYQECEINLTLTEVEPKTILKTVYVDKG